MNGAEDRSTPELAMASLGSRVVAGLVDLLVLVLVFGLASALFGDAGTEGDGISTSLEGPALLAYLAIVYLYYFAGEATSGATPGKRVARIRVVSADGGRARPGQVAARTILRLIDSLPALYLVGVISIVATGKRRARLGDLAGRTAVVDEEQR